MDESKEVERKFKIGVYEYAYNFLTRQRDTSRLKMTEITIQILEEVSIDWVKRHADEIVQKYFADQTGLPQWHCRDFYIALHVEQVEQVEQAG